MQMSCILYFNFKKFCMKKIFILSVLLFGLFSCNNNQKINTSENGEAEKNNVVEKKIADNNVENQKIKIISPIIPVSSMINYIWWNYVSVENLVWAWVSPHHFDLSIAQMTKIEKTDLVINIWIEDADWYLDKAIVWKDDLVLSEWLNLLDSEEEEEHKDETHDKLEIEKDPHIWNSFTNSKIMAEKIAKKLTEYQPKYKDVFEKNLASFNKKIDDLKSNFEEKTKWKKQTHFIIFHNAYNYLFKDLGIKKENKLVFRHNVLAEPNSVEMKELIDNIKKYNVKVAFVEPQFSNSTLTKIAKEYNIEILTLDPLWKDTSKEGFISNFKSNLDSLYKIYE